MSVKTENTDYENLELLRKQHGVSWLDHVTDPNLRMTEKATGVMFDYLLEVEHHLVLMGNLAMGPKDFYVLLSGSPNWDMVEDRLKDKGF